VIVIRDGGYQRIGSIFEVLDRFPSEEACRSYLFSQRWPNGFACTRCGGVEYYHITTRDLYECAYCHYQVSVTAGTVMEGTRTPLRAWFALVFLMANQRTGVSVLSASRMLGISYKRASLMARKIRRAMEERDSLYALSGIIEMDESYFGSRARGGKHGRGAPGKRPVLIAVSLDGEAPRYARMRVMEAVTADEISKAIGDSVLKGTRVVTDGYVSYPPALDGFDHEARALGSGQAASDKLPWVHILASNVKAMIRGTHHGVSPRRLQAYLCEFCWRFSRRRFTGEHFDRLLFSCIEADPVTYRHLVAA
jgi:transposase-like protein